MNLVLSKRYAMAFMLSLKDNADIQQAYDGLLSIRDLLSKSENFSEFISSKILPVKKRQEILELLFSKTLDQHVLKFLNFLNHKSRLIHLKDIINEFENSYYKHKKIKRAVVETRIGITESQVQAIAKQLKLRFQSEIEIESKINKHLLGGIKIYIGDEIFDFTIQTQLNNFKKQVLHN